MKSIKLFFAALLMTGLFTTVHAQQASIKAEVIKTFNKVAEAFNTGNDAHGWSYYAENACEITPDGTLTVGKPALKASWDGFMKMADSRPTFTYTNPSVQVITSDVAVLTFDSEADIKIKGQQVGGKTKGIAVLHKVNGQWIVEADAITPVTSMPALNAQTSTKFSENEVFKAIDEKAKKAFRTNDVQGFVSLFTVDAVHVSPMGQVVKGKEALTKHFTELFKMFGQGPKPDRVTSERLNETGQFISPDVYTTTFNEKSTSYFGNKTQEMEEAHSVLLVKKGNDWLIQNITVTFKGEMPKSVAKN